MALRPTTELWIGDSHALCFNDRLSTARLVRGRSGQFVWHLGPRIMWSVASRGFPTVLLRAARVLGRLSRAGRVVPVFCLGEIDVRCHLVGRADQPEALDFVDGYVDRCCDVARALRASATVLVVPPPPSAECPEIPQFPIRGTIAERVAAFERLRNALASSVTRTGTAVPVLLLDATADLAGDDGAMLPGLTIDGVHTDVRGGEAVRQRLRELHPAGLR